MSDRALLEDAARAAGLDAWWGKGHQADTLFVSPSKPDTNGIVTGVGWNPLQDDGDALRLAVKLGLRVCSAANLNTVAIAGTTFGPSDVFVEEHNGDPYAATRRAITRAAAEIWRAKK